MDIKDFTTQELLEELLRRERTDNSFEIKTETVSSITLKFYKYE
jgi:hypothetical protein